MSDTEKGEGKALPWTEEAKASSTPHANILSILSNISRKKNQFLLRIIGQFKEDGKQINWSRVDMPGRTTKSLQNMWTKINKMVSELETKGVGEANVGGTPTRKLGTPRKSRAKKAQAPTDDESDDNQMSTKKATPRKRAATGTPKRPAKAQKTEHDDDISLSIKVEVTGDESI
ncbi:hypothetical protein EDB81DRAFT_943595 [Dactylonectria macrodidyma]|uniref:Uncharacterized protein n=1 Tax=Dactylonectria macrodidyma TaxID=307937 RepID=A0A9P9FFX6_9HYPO|nr:hypothetical protein EDB81DRAFT_943595 [Dactylonectria macrodidyma]